MNVSRRVFLKSGGVAMIGMSTIPAFLQRAVASTPMPNKKKLIVLFQRGAADGLNMVVPFGEPNYYRIRPSIAIPQPRQGAEGAAVDLDGIEAIVAAPFALGDIALFTAVTAAVTVIVGSIVRPFYTALALAVFGDLCVRKEGTDLAARISLPT